MQYLLIINFLTLLFFSKDDITNLGFMLNSTIKIIYLFYLIRKCQMLGNVTMSGYKFMNILKD